MSEYEDELRYQLRVVVTDANLFRNLLSLCSTVTDCITLLPDTNGIAIEVYSEKNGVMISTYLVGANVIESIWLANDVVPVQVRYTVQLSMFLAAIKKKDRLMITVSRDMSMRLNIMHKTEAPFHTFSVVVDICAGQTYKNEPPNGYATHINIAGPDIVRACKDLNRIAPAHITLCIQDMGRMLEIASFDKNMQSVGKVRIARVAAHQPPVVDQDVEGVLTDPVGFHLPIASLSRLLKIGMFCKVCSVYILKNSPLRISSTIAELGYIDLYMLEASTGDRSHTPPSPTQWVNGGEGTLGRGLKTLADVFFSS